jgi:hypothetical protein
MFGFMNNQMLRGATNRSFERLAMDFGPGPATGMLALALGHACYPTATYGDNAIQDDIIQRLKQYTPRPCDAALACQHVEAWLDKGELSTQSVFLMVWGLPPDDFLGKLLETYS